MKKCKDCGKKPVYDSYWEDEIRKTVHVYECPNGCHRGTSSRSASDAEKAWDKANKE